jgi:hypothetical protein
VSLDLEFTILLPGGGVFRFAGPFPMSCGKWEHIRTVMDAMAPGLVTAANEDSNRCPPPAGALRNPLSRGLMGDLPHCEHSETATGSAPR